MFIFRDFLNRVVSGEKVIDHEFRQRSYVVKCSSFRQLCFSFVQAPAIHVLD
jgi:hypothetical protein